MEYEDWNETYDTAMQEALSTAAIEGTTSQVLGNTRYVGTATDVQTVYDMGSGEYQGGTAGSIARITNQLNNDLVTRISTTRVRDAGNSSQPLDELISLYEAEAEAWRNGNPDEAREYLQRQRAVLLTACAGNSQYSYEYEQCLGTQSLRQGTAAQGEDITSYFNSLRSYSTSELEHINRDLLPLATEPRPRATTDEDISTVQNDLSGLDQQGDTTQVSFIVSNGENGGFTTDEGYLSFSHSDSLRVTNIENTSGDSEQPTVDVSEPSEDIATASGGTMAANHTLVDISESYEPGETNVYTVTFERTSSGTEPWIAFRTAFAPAISDVSDTNYIRSPSAESYSTDQQGWAVQNITTGSESSIDNPPIAALSVSEPTVEVDETLEIDTSNSTDDGTLSRTISVDTDSDGTSEDQYSSETVATSFTQAGVAEIQLTVTDDSGQSATTTTNVTVESASTVQAEFTTNRSYITPDNTTTFTATSAADTYEWDFDGDGTTDQTGESVAYTFDSAGEQSVTLTALNSSGESDSTTTTFTIESLETSIAAPTPVIEAPSTVDAGTSVTLDASESTDKQVESDGDIVSGNITSYEWDLDGDGVTDQTGATVTTTFDTGGDYTINLTLADNDSNSVTATLNLSVDDSGNDGIAPDAEFTFSPSTPSTGENVTFNAGGSTDSDGTLASYEWDFDGDGATDQTGETAITSFGEGGNYSVSLTVSDGDGNIDTTTHTVEILSLVVDRSSDSNYDTIQNAVDNASDGDTVTVRSGDYPGNINVDKNITLVAPNRATLNGSVGPSGSAVTIQNDINTTILGFNITNYQTGLDASGTNGDWTIEDTIIRNVGGGSSVSGAVDAGASGGNWTIQNVTIRETSSLYFGVFAEDSDGNWQINNITVTNSSLSGISAVRSTGNWQIGNSKIINSEDYGIFASEVTGEPSIQNTTISNSIEGIYAADSTADWVIENTHIQNIKDNPASGEAANGIDGEQAGGNWTIRNSSIRNTTTGIEAGDSTADWDFRNTSVTDAEYNIFAYDSEGDWSISNSRLSGASTHNLVFERSTGDLNISQSKFSNASFIGIDAVETGGEINISDTELINVSDSCCGRGGIYAFGSSANWTLRNVSVRNSSGTGIDAGDSSGNWVITGTVIKNVTAAVSADYARGNWSINNTNITFAESGVDISDTSGEWQIHESIIANISSGDIIATNTDAQINASYNWWGQSIGPKASQYTNNVIVSPYYVDSGFSSTDYRTLEINAEGPYSTSEGQPIRLNYSVIDSDSVSISDSSWNIVSGPGSINNSSYRPPDNITSNQQATVELIVAGNEDSTGADTAEISIKNRVSDIDPTNLPGSGTVTEPYVITNASELQAMADNPNANYQLGNNISASATSQWNGGSGFTPVGTRESPFTGTLDGNNYTISEIQVNRSSEDYIGLFGVIGAEDAVVKHVDLKNISVRGDAYVGGIAGEISNGTVRRTTITGSITGSVNSGNSMGGVTGSNNGIISKTSVNISLTAAPTQDGSYIYTAGGIAGSNNGIISNVSSSGKLNAEMVEYVGGAVGSNSGIISDSYTTISVAGSEYVGGFVGYNSGSVNNSFAAGTVNGSSNVGGFAGSPEYASGAVIDSYWDINISEKNDSAHNATGLTTSQMRGEAARDNMGGLNFGDIWKVQSNDYPILIWQTEDSRGINTAPTANINYTPTTPTTDQSVYFNSSESFDTDGVIQSYEWDIDGDEIVEESGVEVNHTYNSEANYSVLLTVTDDDGSTANSTITITVKNDTGLSPNLTVHNARLNTTSVQPGDTVEAAVDIENTGNATGNTTLKYTVDGDTRESQTVAVANGSEETVQSTFSFTDTGEYLMTINGLQAGTVSVESEDGSGSGGDGGSGDGGNGDDGGESGGPVGGGDSGGSVSDPTTPTTPTPTDNTSANDTSPVVDVESRNESSVAVEVNVSGTNETTNGTVTAAVAADVQSESGAVEAESVEIATTATSYEGSVSVSDEVPADAPSENSIGTVEVSHTVSESEISEATFTLGVEQDTLDARDVAPGDVALYRSHDGEWTRLDTRHIGTDGNMEWFQIQSPGLSTFVLGTTNGSAVAEISINNTTPSQGDTVGISAVINNTEATEQTYTLNFSVGDTVAERTVTVAGNTSTTVTHTTQLSGDEGASERDVYVNNIYAGSIDITPETESTSPEETTPVTEQPSETTPTGPGSATTAEMSPEVASTETDSVTTTDGASGPGFTMVTVLLAAVLSLLLARRSLSQEQ
ncbi:PKD domain-containing protein [Halomicroarcula sp. F28]|uniref:PKD domain-containing protein n=1 Tax=Haloarcula salinisoli TaxID=2487746 RepID=UPI001C72F5B3|nr:PKD domain-containing protein [Halomicroarcula salinisoli]MBX0288542.1 PKD domain-containing protein [Halomicroarcula salinisoli]